MLWMAIGGGALTAALVLAVDVGRLHSVKSDLQTSTDAAARAALGGLDDGTYVSRAISAAAANSVEGQPVVVQAADVSLGTWDTATRTFYPGYGTWPNAVRVIARLGPGNSNQLSNTVAKAMGGNDVAITRTAIAAGGEVVTHSVDARSNPWYSGMAAPPVGSGQPPRKMVLTVYPGQILRLVSTGGVQDSAPEAAMGPDGDLAKMSTHALTRNGMSNITAPETSVIAAFLGPDAPNLTAAPPNLNFSTAAARDYVSISPQLKQIFFTGNGQRSNGDYQTIVVPLGATRCFVGVMEGSGYDSNLGGYTTYAASRTTKLLLVK